MKAASFDGPMDVGGNHCHLAYNVQKADSAGHNRSQSRMRGDYLFYEEKVETTQEEKDAKAARRSVIPCILKNDIEYLFLLSELVEPPIPRHSSQRQPDARIDLQNRTVSQNRPIPQWSIYLARKKPANGTSLPISRYVIMAPII